MRKSPLSRQSRLPNHHPRRFPTSNKSETAKYEGILSTVTARFTCEEDFTFPDKRGDLALTVRSALAPRISEMLGRESAKVSIDKEGDVALEVKNVYIYITRFGASCSIVRVPLGTLSAATLTQSMPNIIAEVHQLRSKFLKPLEYALRIYCSVWSQDASGVKRMHSEYFSPLRKVVPSEGNLLELTSLSCSYGYVFGQFKDKIDIESGHPEVTFRIVRQADASQFPDFAKFWDKVDIQDMVGKIEPFLDALEAKQSGISGLLGGTAKR